MASCSSSSATTCIMQLEDFVGEWTDSMGHRVRVKSMEHFSLGRVLDVELSRPYSNGRPALRLSLKAFDQGKFQCGHYELNMEESSVQRIVWNDVKVKGKVSVWKRQERVRSRSRSQVRQGERQRVNSLYWSQGLRFGPVVSDSKASCGCVSKGGLVLHCVDHVPRSVLHDISTPGAWTPSAKESQADAKPSESSQLLEAYDQMLTQTTELQQPHSPQEALHKDNVNSLVKHSALETSHEAHASGALQAKASEVISSIVVPLKLQAGIARDMDAPRASPDALSEAKTKLLMKLEENLIPNALTSPPTRHRITSTKDAFWDPRARHAADAALVGGA